METKKLIAITVAVVVVLNVLHHESKKSFDKSVIEAIKNNPAEMKDAIKAALGVPSAAPPAEAPPSEEEQMKKALADKVNVDLGNTPVFGNKNAKIKLVVFSDFQCPFSKRGVDTTHELIKKYGNNIMYVYKNLPLPFHPESMPAAKAALAAGRQGKFYEYHDKLFENQAQLGEELYVKIAKELGLNLAKFNADRNSKEIEDQIKADNAQANSLGFNGTPGFALNGVKILGAYPQDHFEKIISALGLG
ncbi:MAG: thioredoxin domain-containing protein [Candidatus Melainabacteria bacterium]|nr:thioredoxin domain-containing protein [Candidatus Melainabacteria bacterium]